MEGTNFRHFQRFRFITLANEREVSRPILSFSFESSRVETRFVSSFLLLHPSPKHELNRALFSVVIPGHHQR